MRYGRCSIEGSVWHRVPNTSLLLGGGRNECAVTGKPLRKLGAAFAAPFSERLALGEPEKLWRSKSSVTVF